MKNTTANTQSLQMPIINITYLAYVCIPQCKCESLRINKASWLEANLWRKRTENTADTVEEIQITSSSATFYGWKYKSSVKYYFVIVEEGEKNIRACKLCAENRTLSYAQNTTSNLKKHL